MNDAALLVNDAALLEVTGLCVEFPTAHGTVLAADDVSFSVARGEIIGLVGESGCGKSATTLALMRMVRPPGRIVRGRILFEGQDVLTMSDAAIRQLRGSGMAMVFQNAMSALDPVFTVGHHVGEVFRAHPSLQKRDTPDARVRILELVRISDAASKVHSYAHQLSGGTAQRAMIGVGLAGEPSLLIADEPTTALDVSLQSQIVELLRSIRRQRRTAIIFITHNLALTAQLCDRIVVMYAGQVVESSRIRDVFRRPRHPYTAGLLESMPMLGQRRGRLRQIQGYPPDLSMSPAGCRFASRCELAQDLCRAETPMLRDGVRCHFPLDGVR